MASVSATKEYLAATEYPRTRTFTFRSARTSVVNALRRIVLSEIPYVATYRDEERPPSSKGGFVVSENTGRLHNDMLVDRLALVPIHLTRSEVEQFIPGSVTLRLVAKNEGSQRMNITSENIQVFLFDKPHPNAKACFPMNPLSKSWPLITRLYPGERLDITATLEKHTPRRHVAFAVASIAAMSFKLDDAAFQQERDRISGDESLDDDARTRALNYCEHVTKKKLVKLDDSGEPEEHALTIESESGLSPQEILSCALDVLLAKFASGALTYDSRKDSSTGSVVFTVSGQGHTFGSVLQDICMRDRKALGIQSIGYYETHPLEDRIVVRVDLSPETAELVDHEQLMSKMRAHCSRVLEKFRVESGVA